MFTCCPACQTLFRVRAESLRLAQGQVRCGRCGAQFNALESLAEDPEALALRKEARETASPVEPGPWSPHRAEDAEELGAGAEQPAASHMEAAAEHPAVPESHVETLPADNGFRGPSHADIHAALLTDEVVAERRGSGLAAGLAVLLLLSLLLAQWLYMQRVPLYERPELRPLLQGFCALLACDLPLPRRPGEIEVLERTVREHPRVTDALLVNLTFVSRADEPVAFPILELRLADVSGNRAAGRRFMPVEYLPAGVDPRTGLLPARPLGLTLELMAPDTDAVSFQFEFF